MTASGRHIGIAVAALCAIAVGIAAFAWPYATAREAYSGLREKFVSELGVDLDALKDENPDTVGWLRIEDTVVDYPVVQGEGEEYLDTAFDGTESKAGTLFLDPLNKEDFTDKVSFIYGHSLLDGSMFTGIPDYTAQWYFDEHQDIVLAIPGKDLKLTPWAAVRQSGSDGTLHVGVFEDEEAWASYKEYVAHYALAIGGQDIEGIDRLVCLVACSYNSWNERTLLFCTVE